MEFDTDDEAVAIANETDYGLSGAVHTKDLARGVRIAKRIHTGMVHVNDATIADEPIVPFGGEKHSGIGRLNGAVEHRRADHHPVDLRQSRTPDLPLPVTATLRRRRTTANTTEDQDTH